MVVPLKHRPNFARHLKHAAHVSAVCNPVSVVYVQSLVYEDHRGVACRSQIGLQPFEFGDGDVASVQLEFLFP